MSDLSQCTVLVVDDTEANLDMLVETLGNDHEVMAAVDGPSALEIAREETPDLILLDIVMPGMDGYDVCAKLKQDKTTADIPVIFLTSLAEVENKTRGFEAGAVDYVTKPFEALEVRARVRTHLSLTLAKRELAHQNEILEEKVKERTRELVMTQDVTIHALASLAETRDNETGGHIRRTQDYVRILAEEIKHDRGLNATTIDLLHKSAPLHDVGKVGVPDAILLKPAKLTSEEFEEMKKHAELGMKAILVAERHLGQQDSSFLSLAREIAWTHHEKWDGSGYPRGLAGEEIPLSGRLMALADVYDALISCRVYKAAFSHAKAVNIILEGRGTHFDPRVVDAFMARQEEFRQTALANADYDEERKALSEPYQP